MGMTCTLVSISWSFSLYKATTDLASSWQKKSMPPVDAQPGCGEGFSPPVPVPLLYPFRLILPILSPKATEDLQEAGLGSSIWKAGKSQFLCCLQMHIPQFLLWRSGSRGSHKAEINLDKSLCWHNDLSLSRSVLLLNTGITRALWCCKVWKEGRGGGVCGQNKWRPSKERWGSRCADHELHLEDGTSATIAEFTL